MREIPAELLNKLMSQHQTKANASDPRMSVTVARAKTTVMDTTYFTTETIRSKTGLGDISLAGRRLVPYGAPDRIYEIHVDDGFVKTATREYPDRLKDGWKDQFILGKGSSVGIAFDGHWELFRKYWRLITTEKPFLFWVDDQNVLWSQLWDESDTKFQLAIGVSKIRAIRAWKNAEFLEKDQGVLVGFIELDGTLNYRSYCQQLDGSYQWENKQKIIDFTGVAVSLNMFITNDYRMGFVVETNTGTIEWFVTHRNWAGMASPNEYLNAGIRNITMNVYPVVYKNTYLDDENINVRIEPWFNVAEPIYPTPISASNDNEFVIRLRFNHSLDVDLTTVRNAFTIRDNFNATYTIISTSAAVDNSEIVFQMVNFSASRPTLHIIYDRNVLALDAVNQGSRFAVESFTFSFNPNLRPPEGYVFECLSVSLPTTFSVMVVHYLVGHNVNTEHLTVGFNSIGFVVTRVGGNPL